MMQFYAQPYDISARGFYFSDASDFERGFKKRLPVEEYSIEWIDGPEEDRLLFEALGVNQGSIEGFFDLVDDLEDYEKPALYYLLKYRGRGPGEDLDDLLQMVEDEVRVYEGDAKDYVLEYIDSAGGVGEAFSPSTIEMYFDYEGFGKMLDSDGVYLGIEDDADRAEEYIASMGGVSELGAIAESYFDVDALARDMEMNGDITEFDFAGQTYTTDFKG